MNKCEISDQKREDCSMKLDAIMKLCGVRLALYKSLDFDRETPTDHD